MERKNMSKPLALPGPPIKAQTTGLGTELRIQDPDTHMVLRDASPTRIRVKGKN